MTPNPTLRLFFPTDRETALNMQRSKLRYDLVRRSDTSGSFTCYTDRTEAQQKALENRVLKAEMFLVVIEFEGSAERIEALVSQAKNSQEGLSALTFNGEAQNLLNCEARFSMEIVPGTEDWLATYGNRAPECGAGCGPWS